MTKNGYFQLAAVNDKTEIRIIPPADGGERVNINELSEYLNKRGYVYDLASLNSVVEAGGKMPLVSASMPIERETYKITVSDDGMLAKVRYYAPSVGGELTTHEEFLKDLQMHNITYGIKVDVIMALYKNNERAYCTDIVVAEGKAPRHGEDARIEYCFNTDLSAKPTLNEDGSVDFFHLNTVCPCSKGQLLAKVIPADEGESGRNVYDTVVRPRIVKHVFLKFGKNIELSEDKLSITSLVDGHVTLVDDKVFVSDVLDVENVDSSSGNIYYEGSVEVKGYVRANFEVRARGNIVVRGIVEGARLIAGGDIIIQRGVNGMSRGVLASKGNIVSKFLENVTASASGYVSAESVLHSVVYAGTEVNIAGKRGFITGGHICATNSVSVKMLGSVMGTATVVEVGARPDVKTRYAELQKLVADIQKELRSIDPVLDAYEQKKNSGAIIDKEKIKHILNLRQTKNQKTLIMEKSIEEMQGLQELIENKNNAQILVSGTVFPGVRVMISEVSMAIQSEVKYCRFVKRGGDVKMEPY